MAVLLQCLAIPMHRPAGKTAPGRLAKLNDLISECRLSPVKGIDKPEPLGGTLSGWWSRRIREHRLVYRVTGNGAAQALEIAQCRYHY